MIKFANAKNIGVAKKNSMIVPCIVKSWLYCSGERNCRPGRASSPRMSIAITPPTTNHVRAVTKYIRPIVLWSVVRKRPSSRDPLSARGTPVARLTIGAGAMVMRSPPADSGSRFC
jgi:hypothetical protein